MPNAAAPITTRFRTLWARYCHHRHQLPPFPFLRVVGFTIPPSWVAGAQHTRDRQTGWWREASRSQCRFFPKSACSCRRSGVPMISYAGEGRARRAKEGETSGATEKCRPGSPTQTQQTCRQPSPAQPSLAWGASTRTSEELCVLVEGLRVMVGFRDRRSGG